MKHVQAKHYILSHPSKTSMSQRSFLARIQSYHNSGEFTSQNFQFKIIQLKSTRLNTQQSFFSQASIGPV